MTSRRINYGCDPSAILDDAGEYPVYGTSGSERQGTGYHYEGESIILGRKGSIDRVHFAEGRFWTIDTAYFLSDFDDTVRSGCTTFCAASICAH